ncbi:hypothetical protein ACFL2H_00470 [Planctomycetota bacterium]
MRENYLGRIGARSFTARTCSRIGIEPLERRDLLAADFLAGDANRDYYVDESDFVLAMKAGKYETEDAAEWAEGDWNGDGEFNSDDHLLVFNSGPYRQGAYDDSAGDAVADLKPVAETEQGEVVLYYDSTNGDLRVGTTIPGALVTTIQVRSASNLFANDPQNGSAGDFDVDFSTDTRFFFGPSGYDSYVFQNSLPTNMPIEALRADLSVDGSLLGGGGLGAVRLVSESASRDGYEPGDSNRDFFFDPADLIQAMKARENIEFLRSDWATGDWNEDGVFNSSDLVAAFRTENYAQGAYDERAGEAHHRLDATSVDSEEADLTIYYDAVEGGVVVVPRGG